MRASLFSAAVIAALTVTAWTPSDAQAQIVVYPSINTSPYAYSNYGYPASYVYPASYSYSTYYPYVFTNYRVAPYGPYSTYNWSGYRNYPVYTGGYWGGSPYWRSGYRGWNRRW